MERLLNLTRPITADLVLDTFLVIGAQNGRHTFSSLDRHGAFLNDNLAGLCNVSDHPCHGLYVGQISSPTLSRKLPTNQIYKRDVRKKQCTYEKKNRKNMEERMLIMTFVVLWMIPKLQNA